MLGDEDTIGKSTGFVNETGNCCDLHPVELLRIMRWTGFGKIPGKIENFSKIL
jgi:hypothetical protein